MASNICRGSGSRAAGGDILEDQTIYFDEHDFNMNVGLLCRCVVGCKVQWDENRVTHRKYICKIHLTFPFICLETKMGYFIDIL